MKITMRISVPVGRNTRREKIAQEILFGYQDPVRWAVFAEEEKREALKTADRIIALRAKDA